MVSSANKTTGRVGLSIVLPSTSPGAREMSLRSMDGFFADRLLLADSCCLELGVIAATRVDMSDTPSMASSIKSALPSS